MKLFGRRLCDKVKWLKTKKKRCEPCTFSAAERLQHISQVSEFRFDISAYEGVKLVVKAH